LTSTYHVGRLPIRGQSLPLIDIFRFLPSGIDLSMTSNAVTMYHQIHGQIKTVVEESGWLNGCEKESNNTPKRRQLSLECGSLSSFFFMTLELIVSSFNHTLTILSASPILFQYSRLFSLAGFLEKARSWCLLILLIIDAMPPERWLFTKAHQLPVWFCSHSHYTTFSLGHLSPNHRVLLGSRYKISTCKGRPLHRLEAYFYQSPFNTRISFFLTSACYTSWLSTLCQNISSIHPITTFWLCSFDCRVIC